jgi:hypothetical protein
MWCRKADHASDMSQLWLVFITPVKLQRILPAVCPVKTGQGLFFPFLTLTAILCSVAERAGDMHNKYDTDLYLKLDKMFVPPL